MTDRKGLLRIDSQLVSLRPGKWAFGILFMACAVGNMNAAGVKKKVDTEWPVSGGSAANTHYSALSQINIGNVSKLQEVWQCDTTEGG